MIDLYNSQITDILPDNLKATADVQALSYALHKAIQKLINYSNQTRIYSAIQSLPERILDILAVELRSQYYDESLPIEIKRNIIQNTLQWYCYAGTPYAVEELISTLLGSGKVKEWFEYEGKRGTFVVETNAQLTVNTVSKFTSMIKKVKNARSHLTKIYFIGDSYEKKYNAEGMVYIPRISIKDSGL